jgi:hypothetical protein
MAAGFVAALVYVRRRFDAAPPIASVLRIAAATAIAVLVGRFFPGSGKISALLALASSGVVYLVALILMREFGVEDRAKFAKILGRRR